MAAPLSNKGASQSFPPSRKRLLLIASTLTGHKDILFCVENKLPFYQILNHYKKSKLGIFRKLHSLTRPICLPFIQEEAFIARLFVSNNVKSVNANQPDKLKNGSSEVIFGSISGIVGKIIEYPFDTVKTRLQVQPLNGEVAFSGPIECFRHGFKEEGFRGFYKGLSAPLVGSMFENSVLFLGYSRIQDMIRKYSGQSQDAPLSMKQLTIAGFFSGALVSFVLTPVELIKCRLQTESTLRGPISIIYHSLRERGVFGLYKGHLSTFLRESVGGAAWFGTYEYCNGALMEKSGVSSKKDLSTWQLMASGALSGIAYNASLFPVDTIKSIQQSSDSKDSFSRIASDLFKVKGVRGFYRGFGITVARSAPSSAVIFYTYEWLSRNIKIEY